MYYDYSYSSYSERIYNVICTGYEAKLVDCSHNSGINVSSAAIRVQCQQSELNFRNALQTYNEIMVYTDECLNGDTRLVGGETEAEGRVEICDGSGRWYTVCGRYWTDNNTAVVCRHLGFSDITGGELFTDIIIIIL